MDASASRAAQAAADRGHTAPVEPAALAGIEEIGSEAELRALLGEPSSHAAHKTRDRLHALDRQWLAHSPFCLLATSDAAGRCDVSPKGDPAGFTHVLDDTTLVIPDRPGNKRVDGFRNVLANPRVGLLYVLPGRSDTLRINGRARLLRDAPFFDALVVKGHRPRLALLVEVEEVFYHCAKAFLRSELWKPETWQPEALPSRARIVKGLEAQDMPLEALEEHYGPRYAERLYTS
ncbi:pyridoxamine 5'-phosphate oxidase family protein [Streptomyces sp. NPDC057555]|uniref:pyridoxamine 5'-phosphate oxidase family protein n=1 Tax=Streptomyces sp. NPDC057555 TaxID=3346166 RepID=UPI003681F573